MECMCNSATLLYRNVNSRGWQKKIATAVECILALIFFFPRNALVGNDMMWVEKVENIEQKQQEVTKRGSPLYNLTTVVRTSA